MGPKAILAIPKAQRVPAALALAILLVGLALAQPGRGQDLDTEGGEGRPFLLTADTITYDTEADIVRAQGEVEISRGGRRLLADEVSYDQRRDRLGAKGNVVLIEPSGDAVFADTVEVTGDLREGFIDSVGVLLTDDSRLAAARGVRRDGNISELESAVYSPCELCPDGEGSPLWQIKARKVIHDQAAKTVAYEDAWFEFLGLPVLYTPYFAHPDPSVKRKSGFLAPSFGSSSELGLLLETPYFFNLAPHYDFTFIPIFTQDAGVVLGGEYRQRHEAGQTRLSGSATYTDRHEFDVDNPKGGQELRGHFRGQGYYEVADKTGAGAEIFLASDNSYLERYKIDNDDVLENRLWVERVDSRDYLGLNGYYFQGLRETDQQKRIPVVLPLAEARYISEPLWQGSQLVYDSNVLALTRQDGLDTRRVSQSAAWQLPFIGPIGDLWRLEASLRGDGYYVEGDPQTLDETGDTATEARLLPKLTTDWSWPLVGETGTWSHEIEPVAALNIAPNGGNSDNIPNEDSRLFEFDETNLFEANRYPGLDRVDGGTRVAYGVRFSSIGPRALEVSGVFGQSYQLLGSSPFPEGSGLDDALSDYVGRVDFRPSALLDLSYRFRLDESDLKLRRSDLNAVFGPSALRFGLGYLNLSSEGVEGGEGGLNSREEVVASVRAQVTPRLAIGAQTRQDLTRNDTVANQVGLIYTDPCLVVAAGLEQSFTTTGEVDDETTLLVRLTFKNLGEVETGSGLIGLN